MELIDEINIIINKITDDKLTQLRLEEELLYHALRAKKVSLEKKTRVIERISYINKEQNKMFKGV